MNQDMPELDALLAGINDPETSDLAGSIHPAGKAAALTPQPDALYAGHDAQDTETCWNSFVQIIEDADESPIRDSRLVCRLRPEISDSLDDCNFNGLCRSYVVNAILRAFLQTYLPKLAAYRKENRSLFARQPNT